MARQVWMLDVEERLARLSRKGDELGRLAAHPPLCDAA